MTRSSLWLLAIALFPAAQLHAQSLPVEDPVLRRIWSLGIDSSRTYELAQPLLDSIGPRLTGSPAIQSGNDWLVARYKEFGITAKNEQYGTWRSWRRGITHFDLLSPRVRTLEAMTLAWSAPTKGRVEGKVIILPDVADSAAFKAWLPAAKGSFVLVSFPQPTCRPDSSFRQSARCRPPGTASWRPGSGAGMSGRHGYSAPVRRVAMRSP